MDKLTKPGKKALLLALTTLMALVAACSGPKPAPDFAFTTYQGEDVLGGTALKLSQVESKPLVLNFWAGLCPPAATRCPPFRRWMARRRIACCSWA